MSMEKHDAFVGVLMDMQAACDRAIARLAAEGRDDDANLQKVARNIYAKAAMLAQSAADEAALMSALEAMCVAWQAARSEAAKHSDYTRTAVEDVKLVTLAKVQAAFDNAMQKEGER